MKDQEYNTESNYIKIADEPNFTKVFAVELSDNTNTFKALFENEDKPSLAKFLRKAADELERTKP